MFDWLKNIFADRKYNQELYRTGKANKNEIRSTTIGWKRDDSYTPDPGNKQKRQDGNGVDEYNTPSGNREYYKVIRRK